MRSNRLNTYLPSLSEASSGVSQDLEEGESTESDNRHKCSEPFHLTVLPASDGVKAPKVEECDKVHPTCQQSDLQFTVVLAEQIRIIRMLSPDAMFGRRAKMLLPPPASCRLRMGRLAQTAI